MVTCRAADNPFRSSRVQQVRYRIAPAERAEVVARWREQGSFGAIEGPMGTGKSTLLEDIANDLDEPVHWLRLNLDMPRAEVRQRIATALRQAPGTTILMDGGEVLGLFAWWRLLRAVRKRHCHLFATVHCAWLIPVVHRTSTDLTLALDLIETLYGESNEALCQVATEAFRKEHGNIREVFRACYWACAGGG